MRPASVIFEIFEEKQTSYLIEYENGEQELRRQESIEEKEETLPPSPSSIKPRPQIQRSMSSDITSFISSTSGPFHV